MSWEGLDLLNDGQRFCKEMERGLSGEPSTLKMIPSYIDPSLRRPIGKQVLVADAGGTHFRIGLVRFAEEGPLLRRLEVYPMPGTQTPLEADDFFQTLAEPMGKMMTEEHPEKLGFCFSYPVEITSHRDGKLLSFTKEIRVTGAEGRSIAGELGSRLPSPIPIVVLNDATAALLGAIAAGRAEDEHTTLCMIVGTGMNTSYAEANRAIVKDPFLKENAGYTVINLESGGYGLVEQGTADQRMDQKTKDPGRQLLEKMISGAYLGNLFLETVLLAVEEGLLPTEPFLALKTAGTLRTKALSAFAQDEMEDDNPLDSVVDLLDAEQLEFLHTLAKGLLRRAAKLLVINVMGMILKILQTRPGFTTFRLLMEGSTYYGSRMLQYYVEAYLKQIHMRLGILIQPMKLENATLLGAALAANANQVSHF